MVSMIMSLAKICRIMHTETGTRLLCSDGSEYVYKFLFPDHSPAFIHGVIKSWGVVESGNEAKVFVVHVSEDVWLV